MSAWTCRQLSERSPKRSFHLVFESHDGTAYAPIPERSTSLRVTSTPPVVDSQKRLTPNGRLEKRTLEVFQPKALARSPGPRSEVVTEVGRATRGHPERSARAGCRRLA